MVEGEKEKKKRSRRGIITSNKFIGGDNFHNFDANKVNLLGSDIRALRLGPGIQFLDGSSFFLYILKIWVGIG